MRRINKLKPTELKIVVITLIIYFYLFIQIVFLSIYEVKHNNSKGDTVTFTDSTYVEKIDHIKAEWVKDTYTTKIQIIK
jgi:hypothetical protein